MFYNLKMQSSWEFLPKLWQNLSSIPIHFSYKKQFSDGGILQMQKAFYLAVEDEQTSKRITVYVQSCGSRLSFADQVLGWATDCHVSGHIENPYSRCALVEVDHASMLTVRPVVLRSWWVSFARAVQQGTATLLHHQGFDMHHHVPRSNWSWREDEKRKTF